MKRLDYQKMGSRWSIVVNEGMMAELSSNVNGDALFQHERTRHERIARMLWKGRWGEWTRLGGEPDARNAGGYYVPAVVAIALG